MKIRKPYKINGTWYLKTSKTIRLDCGKKVRKYSYESLGSNISEAEAYNESYQRSRGNTKAHSKELTWGRFVPIFLESYKNSGVRPATVNLAKNNIKVLNKFLYHSILHKIDFDEIENLKNSLIDMGYSNRGINIKLNCVSLLLKFALRKGFIDKKPIIDPLPNNHAKKVCRLTQTQIRKLINQAETLQNPTNTKVIFFLKLMLYTGMRPYECHCLKWKHIDFVNRSITILSTNPNKKGRTIPIHQNIYNMLLDKKQKNESFVSPYRTSGIQSILKRLSEKLPFKINVKMLRATFISIMIESGVDIAKVVKITGHSYNTCLKYYAELRTDLLRNDMNQFKI